MVRKPYIPPKRYIILGEKMVKVIDANVVNVKKNIYRVIRSFVDSSTKDSYHWNTGVRVGDVVTFTKMNKWTLRIIKTQCTAILASDDVEVVYRPCHQCSNGSMLEIYYRGKIELAIPTLEEAVKTFIVADVPYATPLQLIDLIEKMQYYMSIEPIEKMQSYTSACGQ